MSGVTLGDSTSGWLIYECEEVGLALLCAVMHAKARLARLELG